MKTREEWLLKAVKALRPVFKAHKEEIPKKLMVGCGWPKGGKNEVIGQCFGKTWTSDETTHIFISPTQGDEVAVLAILVHELVHAIVGTREGHKGKFKKLARDIGLEGKLTATVVTENSPLYSVLKKIAKELGKYPHSKMLVVSNSKGGGETNPRDKWVRVYSTATPGYRFLVPSQLLADYGYPTDLNGKEMTKEKPRRFV